MSRDSFVAEHQESWDRLANQLGQIEELRNAPMSNPAMADLPQRYRELCHQLALVRTRGYGADLEQRLHELVQRGHRALHAERGGDRSLRGLVDLLLRRFPRRVRARWALFLLATSLLYVPQWAMRFAVRAEPELVYSLVSPQQTWQFESMYGSEESVREERPAESDVMMFGFYIYNNISVAFRTFAGGLLLGVGAVLLLVFNGLYFGAIQGHLENEGLQENFYSFVIGHGSFEVTAICIAGAAGFALAFALLRPQPERTRIESLRATALEEMPMIWGTVAFLVIAAFIEAFWSSTPTEPIVRYVVGAALWFCVAMFLLFAGRRRA